MQNLRSLDNLIQQPILGKNDNFQMTMPRPGVAHGFPKLNLYDYDTQMEDHLREIDEPHRKVLSRELLTPAKQD